MSELSPQAEAKDMEFVPTRRKGRTVPCPERSDGNGPDFLQVRAVQPRRAHIRGIPRIEVRPFLKLAKVYPKPF